MEHNTAKNNDYPIPLWTGTTKRDPQALVDSVLETASRLEHLYCKRDYLLAIKEIAEKDPEEFKRLVEEVNRLEIPEDIDLPIVLDTENATRYFKK